MRKTNPRTIARQTSRSTSVLACAGKRGRLPYVMICCVLWACRAGAAEVHSNGIGGGPWSDPDTWRAKKVPGPEDEAIIARGDSVVFDRNDDAVSLPGIGAAVVGSFPQALGKDGFAAYASLLGGVRGKVTCAQLHIDPKGMLSFKSGMGKVVLCVSGPVESFGMIKLDARNSAQDSFELRLVGPTLEKRKLQLQKGGALAMHGRKLGDGKNSVAITCRPQNLVKAPLADSESLGTVDGIAGSSIDLQKAEVVNVQIGGNTIDNTGAKPNERFNIGDSRFTDRARIVCIGCDTPIIANNIFDYVYDPWVMSGAMYLNGCSLAEIRGNSIKGYYYYGITASAMVDGIVENNTIEGTYVGLYWYGENGMVKKATIKGCNTGVVFTSASGAMEDVTIEGATTGYYHGPATVQASNLVVDKLQKGGVAIHIGAGSLTLLNCNIKPEQIKLEPLAPPPPKPPEFRVQAMEFLVVGVKDAPPATIVDVVTVNGKPLPPGATDLNIRNAPARVLSNNLTNLPKTMEPLIVRSWMIDANGKTVPTPEYTVKILGPAPGAGAPPKLLKTMNVKPQESWFRAKPNDAKATVEISLK